MQIDDDIRWLVALISDTGMRLADAAELSVSYFNLQGDIPFVEVRPHPWRSLKTSANARVIPLSGMALWGAQRILQKAALHLMCFQDTIVDHAPVQTRRALQLTSG